MSVYFDTAQEEASFHVSSKDDCLLADKSLVTWFQDELNDSFPTPSIYQKIEIEDRGSIEESLRHANIDIFDRQIVPLNPLVKIAAMIGKMVIIGIVGPILGVLGTCYHGSMLLKHAVIWKTRGNELDLDRVYKHGNLMQIDAYFSMFIWYIPVLIYQGEFISDIIRFSLPLSFIVDFFLSQALILCGGDSSGEFKSQMLRDRFGIVSKQTGKLLTWDLIKDKNEVSIHESFYNTYYYKTDGYFSGLYEQQSKKLLEEIKALQLALPTYCKIPFFYPPTGEEICVFLDEHKDYTNLTSAENEKWKEKFRTLDKNIQSVWEIVKGSYGKSSESKSGNVKYILARGFPFSDKICQFYFT